MARNGSCSAKVCTLFLYVSYKFFLAVEAMITRGHQSLKLLLGEEEMKEGNIDQEICRETETENGKFKFEFASGCKLRLKKYLHRETWKMSI